MFSPLLIKISFATISSVGVALGGYFVYKKASSKEIEGGITKNTEGSDVNSDVVASLPEGESETEPTVHSGTTPTITQTPK